MTRSSCSIPLVLLLVAGMARAGGLPDTGQGTCYNDTVADSVSASSASSIARDVGTHPRQDCRYGRDAAAAAGMLGKTGAGDKGFDYTKIANNGTTLAAGAALGTAATDWACTRDNITGLTWEVKTVSGLRNSAWSYTWYISNAAVNGGNAGTVSGGSCQTVGRCDTEKFVADVNAAALCGYTDWRMPTQRELLTLVYADGSYPSIDPTYFPNTNATNMWWSESSSAPNPLYAWVVMFDVGYTMAANKANGGSVRLVRGGPF